MVALLSAMMSHAVAQNDTIVAFVGDLPTETPMRDVMFPKQATATWSAGFFFGSDYNNHIIDMAYANKLVYTGEKGKTAGVFAQYWLTGWLSGRADVLWLQKNYRMVRENPNISFCHTNYTNNYLQIPLTAHISFGRNAKVYGFGGFYVGYWMSGHREGQSFSVTYLLTGDESTTHFDEDYEFDSQRDNRFDAGWTFGGGLQVTMFHRVIVFGEMRWYYGITDIQKNYMNNLNPQYNTTRAFQFGAAYWFGNN